MKYLNILYFLLAAGLLLQCSKKSSSGKAPLPTQPVTCENAQGNCFRCEINGEEWVAQTSGSIGGPMAHYVDYSEQYDGLSIACVREIPESKFEQISILIRDIHTNPTISLGEGETPGFTDYNQNSPCSYALYSPHYPCSLEIIEHDTINKIIEAGFELILYNEDCGPDSLTYVHNGHFRLHY